MFVKCLEAKTVLVVQLTFLAISVILIVLFPIQGHFSFLHQILPSRPLQNIWTPIGLFWLLNQEAKGFILTYTCVQWNRDISLCYCSMQCSLVFDQCFLNDIYFLTIIYQKEASKSGNLKTTFVAEEKIKKLKKRNTELVSIARQLEDKAKKLQEEKASAQVCAVEDS